MAAVIWGIANITGAKITIFMQDSFGWRNMGNLDPMDFVTWLIKIAFNPIGVRGQLDLSEVAKSSRGPVWFGQEFWGSGPKSSDHNREQPILRVWENIIAHHLQVSLSHTNTWIYIQAISASEAMATEDGAEFDFRPRVAFGQDDFNQLLVQVM